MSLEGFCFAYILRNIQILNESSVFRIYYSYLAKNCAMILSRSFDFVRNILLNFLKGNGDKE